MSEKIDEKRSRPGHGNRKVILLHENARTHVALSTHETMMELDRDVMAHPAYSAWFIKGILHYELFKPKQQNIWVNRLC